MAELYLSVRTISPLAMRSDHAPKGSKTATVISGNTLLGSLAATHRLFYTNQPDKEQDFIQFFLSGDVFYPNLYPARFEDEEVQAAQLPVYPAPKTAQTCKRHPGFLKDDDDDQHGVRDTLLDWASFKLSGGNSPKAFVGHKLCPHCDAVVDHLAERQRYYRWIRFRPAPYNRMSAEVQTRLQTRTGINRQWDTVQEDILYNREVIEEDMYFWGTLKLPDDLVSTFTEFVNDANDAQLVRIGTGRTRGLGQVNLTVSVRDSEDEEQNGETFTERLEKFDAQLRKGVGEGEKELAPFYFSVTLHSQVILQDNLLRYYGGLKAETLADLLKLSEKTFEQIHQVASIVRVAGWNNLWGTPRMQEYAIDTGSVFLFACGQKLDEALLKRLFELEVEGIGQRRSEGFGRIYISDPFHREGVIA